jgi:hypothetical protein
MEEAKVLPVTSIRVNILLYRENVSIPIVNEEREIDTTI